MPRRYGARGQVLETPWTRELCEDLRKHNAVVRALVGSSMQGRGLPDRLIWHRWWHGLVEFKGRDTTLRPEQVTTIRDMWQRCPGSVYVVREPGLIEDWRGRAFTSFGGAGSLLAALRLVTADVLADEHGHYRRLLEKEY